MPNNTGHVRSSGLQANNSAIHQQVVQEVLKALENQRGAMQLAGRKFESKFGGKQGGDSVVVNVVGTPVIKDYTRGQSIVYDPTNSGTVKLYLTQSKYSAVQLDDLDDVELSVNLLAEYQMRMAEGFADTMNRFIVSDICASAIAVGHNVNMALDENNIIKGLIDFKQTFSSRLALKAGETLRIALPLEAQSLLEAHMYNKQTPQMVDDNKLSTPVSGYAPTIKLFESLEVTFDSTLTQNANGLYQCPAAVTGGYEFFAAMEPKTEKIRLQSTFADATRALAHYGGGVVYDAKLGCISATFS